MILTIFDLETTGLDKKKDQIIQIAALKMNTDTHQIIESLNEYIQPVGSYTISIGAFFKHGISPEFLKDKPHFKDISNKLYSFFKNSDNILTYNGNSFDIPFLIEEFNKCGHSIDFLSKNCYDAFLEEKRRNGNTLEETYRRYKGKSMEEAGLKAHDAFSDIKATYTVFIAQQKKQPYNPEKMYGEDNAIVDMKFFNVMMPCFNIGKYRGISVQWVGENDQNYLKWAISDKANFVESTKNYLRQYIK